MATVFTIKQNDTRPKLVTTLSGFGGGATLASATSVAMKMRSVGGAVVTLAGSCAITDAANNVVTYTWNAADTATNGTFEVEWEILWSDGGIETVPNDSYNTVIVKDDIA